MDWMKLPPLNSLRAFATVAEAGGYTFAAERLNVTQAAVSQQVFKIIPPAAPITYSLGAVHDGEAADDELGG